VEEHWQVGEPKLYPAPATPRSPQESEQPIKGSSTHRHIQTNTHGHRLTVAGGEITLSEKGDHAFMPCLLPGLSQENLSPMVQV